MMSSKRGGKLETKQTDTKFTDKKPENEVKALDELQMDVSSLEKQVQ